MESFGRVLALKGALMQQQQQQQMMPLQLQEAQQKLQASQNANLETGLKQKDDQITSQTFLQAGGDPKKHIQMMAAAGARTQAVQATQQHYEALDKTAAETDEKKAGNQLKRNDLLLPLHDSAIALAQSDPQEFARQWRGILAQATAIDPAAATHFSADQVPTVQQLTASKNLHLVQDYSLKQAKENRDAELHPLQVQAEQGTVTKTGLENTAAQRTQDASDVAAALKQGGPGAMGAAIAKLPQDRRTAFAGLTAQAKPEDVLSLGMKPNEQVTTAETARRDAATAANEQRLRTIAEGNLAVSQGHMQIARDIYNQTYGEGANPALVGVEPAQRKGAMTAAQKAADDYTKAMEAASEMKAITDLARSGNKIAYAYAPTTGVLTINSANGSRRVNVQELKAYGGAGSVGDKIEGWLGGKLSGASIPANILDSMDQFHQSIADNQAKSYNTKLDGINQNYRSNFKPVKATGGASQQGGGAKSYTHTATGTGGHKIGSDDGKTWFDVQTGKQVQ